MSEINTLSKHEKERYMSNSHKLNLSIVCAALLTTTAHADIVSTNGLTVIAPPSVTVQADFLVSNGLPPQIIFAEQQNVVLANPLTLDIGGPIAAGTVVNSYLVAWNAFNSLTNFSADNTSVTFDGAVLGVIYRQDANGIASPNYAASDFLGSPNVTYNESSCLFCAFELFDGTDQLRDFDIAIPFGNSVFFHNLYSDPGDVARILVAQPSAAPGPIAGAGLPGLIFAIGGFIAWWRKREAA
jgi:hypothetical protein